MNTCLFCRIVSKSIATHFVFEDNQCICIEDIQPQAPMHLLVIPKQHIATLNDISSSQDESLIGHMFSIVTSMAKSYGYAESGYRTIFNCNQDGGQSVYHLHLHVLGGRPLNWPPG